MIKMEKELASNYELFYLTIRDAIELSNGKPISVEYIKYNLERFKPIENDKK